MNTTPHQLSAEEKRVIEFEARATAANGAARALGHHINGEPGVAYGGIIGEIRTKKEWLAQLKEGDPRRAAIEREIARLEAIRGEWETHRAAAQERAQPALGAARDIRQLFDRMQSTANPEGMTHG